MIRLFRESTRSCLSVRVEDIGLTADIFNYLPSIMSNVIYSHVMGMYSGWTLLTVENLEGKVVLSLE